MINKQDWEALVNALAYCYISENICQVHPKYDGHGRPGTPESLENDGCTCKLYWDIKTQLEKQTRD